MYYQLKNIIIDMIENEEIGVDECIPSEPKLMQTYNLSRTTVRKAIDELVNEGYLYKKQGIIMQHCVTLRRAAGQNMTCR